MRSRSPLEGHPLGEALAASDVFEPARGFAARIVTDNGFHPDVSNPDDGHMYAYHDCTRVDLSQKPFLVVGEDDTEYRAHSLIVSTGTVILTSTLQGPIVSAVDS